MLCWEYHQKFKNEYRDISGTTRINTTPLQCVAMFSLQSLLFSSNPPAHLSGSTTLRGEGGGGPIVEAAVGASQFPQHLLLTLLGYQPTPQNGKHGAGGAPNPSSGRFWSCWNQSRVSQHNSSAHLPSRCTLSHFKLQWHLLFGFHCISAVVEHVTCLKSSAD